MKKIFLGLILVSVSVISANAQAIAPAPQTASTGPQATIRFKEAENTHDFGAIPQGTPVTYNFVFSNTGKAPLILSSVAPSCGCTTPEWPKEAIAPGKTGVIKVTYNAANLNGFDKVVTVSSNASDAQVVLHIKGDVKPAPAAATQSTPVTQQGASPKKN